MTARSMVGAVLVLTALGRGAQAEEPAAAKPDDKAMGCCQQVMQKEKAGVVALESKAAAMNAAQGADKVDAIAAVVNELVAQHRAMHGDQGCPGGCPMMKEMKENMWGMMGSGMEHGAMEHGEMQHDVPTPPSAGATP
jgi:hypothetical protein